MVLSTARPASKTDPYDEGYPSSSEADLDPGPDSSESLDYADRVASAEHRVAVQGVRLELSGNEEHRYEDADDVDDAESRP
jgi:hypothetical protein